MKTGPIHQNAHAWPKSWALSAHSASSENRATARAPQAAEGDWELAVRSAFFRECMRHGVRAELARQTLARAGDREEALRDQLEASARRAALGWLRLETSLAHYGELAAFALARCLDEAALDVRCRSAPPSSPASTSSLPPARTSQVVPREGEPHALSIVERGRERLARFWESNRFCAA
jgi:hypothetical protein